MTDVPTFHDQRDRAESFGAVAAAYDRYRPGYPDELIDELAALHPSAVLDIGCGTGKAGRQLAARGLPVLGVEIDAQMAAVARGHGLDVEVSSFEEWDDRGRTYDLIVAGQAWHWVDPAIGAPKVVRLLRAGGQACFFWNFEDMDDATEAILDDVYRRVAPELLGQERATEQDGLHAAALRATGCFTRMRECNYRYAETLAAEEWIRRISTYSRNLLLGDRLSRLRDALRAELPATLHLRAGTYAIWAQP